MVAPSSGQYGSSHYETPEGRALASITIESYRKIYDDQGKFLGKLAGDVSYLGATMRKAQGGIDKANENVVQQLQDLINNFIVILGGGSFADSGIDLGDLKYVAQAIGALLGFQSVGGIPLPINVFDAAWHFFSQYIFPVENFTEVINTIIDGAIATGLDIFGEVPIVGQAVEQLAVIISDLRDLLNPIAAAVDALLSSFGLNFDDLGGITSYFTPIQPILDAFTQALSGISLPDFVPVFHTIALWTAPFVNLIVAVINAISPLLGDTVEVVVGVVEPIFSWITPVIQALAPLLDIITAVVTALNPILDAITTVVTALNPIIDAVTSVVNALAPILDQITNVSISLDPVTGPILDLVAQIAPIISDVVTVVVALADPVINFVITIVNELASIVGGTDNLSNLSNFLLLISSPLNANNLFNLIPPGLIGLLDASKITSGTFLPAQLQPFIDAISTGFGGLAGLNFNDLQSFLLSIPGVGGLVDTFVNTFLNLGGSGYGTNDLIRALQSIPMNFLTGSLMPGQISHLNIGSLSNVLQEYLVNPNFDSANSISGQGQWIWDGTQGPPGVTTSVYAVADGTQKELFSNPIAVAQAQVFNVFGNTKWSGFTGAANSIMLTVAKFDASNTLIGYDTIGSIASPGSSGGWTTLSNASYTVPSGVSTVVLRPLVTSAATAGQVWFGKLSFKQTATSLIASLVGVLDASKITSGQFAQSFVQNLTTQFAGLGTSTSILAQLIGLFPNVTGGLAGLAGLGSIFTDMLGLVGSPTALGSGAPVLPAIGSIPVLGGLLTASKIKTSLIAALDASAITTGQFAQSFVTGLPTMFSGLVNTSSITSQLNKGNIADLGTITDHATNAFIGAGSQFINSTIPQARGSMDSIFKNVIDAVNALQAMRSDSAATSVSGTSVSIDFSNYADGAMPSNFTVTYSGAGTSTIGITSGNAGWRALNNDGNRNANVVYNVAPTATDFQIVRGSMQTAPAGASSGGQPMIYALGRVDNPANPQNYVWGRAYCTGFLTYKADIGYTVAGVETIIASNIPLSWSLDISVVFGVNGNPRRYQAYSGTSLVADVTEAGTASMLGSGFRYWGCRNTMKTGSGGASSGGTIAATAVSDNQPPSVLGSTFRASRHSTTNVGLGSGGVFKTPGNFFDTMDWCSPDMSWDGTNLTINTEGTYLVALRYNITTSVTAYAAIFQNPTSAGVSYSALMGGGSTAATAIWGLATIYAKPGDVLNPGYQISAGANINGEASGSSSYFEVALLNRSMA